MCKIDEYKEQIESHEQLENFINNGEIFFDKQDGKIRLLPYTPKTSEWDKRLLFIRAIFFDSIIKNSKELWKSALEESSNKIASLKKEALQEVSEFLGENE